MFLVPRIQARAWFVRVGGGCTIARSDSELLRLVPSVTSSIHRRSG